MPTTGNQPPILDSTSAAHEPSESEVLIDFGDISPLEKPATLQSALDQTERVPAEEEQALFSRLHFLKFRREALQSTLESSGDSKKLRREIQKLTQEIESTRNTIAEKFLRLLASIARQLAPSSQDYDDYFSEGSTVLLYAIDKFDPARGYRFSTYATHAVRRHLYRVSKRRLKQRKREIASEMAFRSEFYEENADDLLTEEEAADATEMLFDRLHCCLDDREREIVVSRFGLGDDPAGKSFQAISDYMGLSKERIRQLFNRAIQKLGQSIQPHFQ